MPTLPEQISGLLTSSNLDADLQGQVSMIADAAALLANLIANPPDEIGDLVAGLDAISISSMQVPDSLTQSFSALAQVVPADLSAVTGNLDTILTGLGDLAGADTLASISSYLGCLQTIAELLTIDLSLFAFGASGPTPSSSSTPGAGSGSGSPAGSGGGSGESASASGGGTGNGDSGTGSEAATEAAAARTRNLETIRGMRGVLDTFPEPFNAENVVRFLSAKLKGIPRHFVNMRHVPLYDDLNQLLDTMIQLADMDGAALQSHVQSTLSALKTALEREGPAPLNRMTAVLNDLATKIDSTTLAAEMTGLTQRLQTIADAVAAADISTIDTDLAAVNETLDTLLPGLNQMLNDLFGGAAAQSITQLSRLPREVDLAMRRLQRMLQPSLSLDLFGVVEHLFLHGVHPIQLNELTQVLADFFQRVTGAMEILNAATLRTALSTVSDALESALDGFDDAMLQLAARVSALFDEVDAALAQIDTTALREQIEGAIADVQEGLEETVNDLFGPVRTAISTAVDTIDTTVSSFDPDSVANLLRGVISEITDVLGSEEVTNALNAIRNALQRVTQQVQALSFSPIIDEVIDGIVAITETLQGIDPSRLNAVTKGALKVAVAVLPDDLEEPRSYLTSELDRIVAEGPIPLLEQIKAPVEGLTNQVKSLSPEKLIGDSLSKPFDGFIAELDRFTPSTLLSPVQDALDSVKDSVREQIDLARLMKPLEDLYNDLISQMDRFGPEQLVDPIEQRITEVLDRLLEILPDEVIFEVLNRIIANIEFVADIVNEVKLILRKIQAMVTALADPADQLRSWLQPVVDLVDALPDIAGLQDLFDGVSGAVDALTAAQLRESLLSGMNPLLDALAALQPQVLLTGLSSACRRLDSSALQSLPDSPQKSALSAALGRFNPLAPPMSRVFSNLGQWQQDLTQKLAAYDTAMQSWDARFFGEGNPFSNLRVGTVTTQALRDLLREGIEDGAIAPVARVLSTIGNVLATFSGPTGELEAFVQSLEEMLEQITTGPDSLGEIRDTLNQLIERVRNINLQFLEDELNDAFDAVKQKFEDVSPAVFREALQAAVDDALDLIDTSLLLPQEDIDDIDQTYRSLTTRLQDLDPVKLVIDVVKPEFDSKVLPLLESFDLSELIETLIQRMGNLAEELASELTRTDQSYQTMLQAVPV